MIASVFSILLSISIINTGLVNNQSVSDLNVPDTGFTQQTTINSNPSTNDSSEFSYFVNVQLPKIKERNNEEQQRVTQLELEQTKAKQEALATIEQEKIRIQQETLRIQQQQVAELERQKQEQERVAQEAQKLREQQAAQAAAAAAQQKAAVAVPNTDYVTAIRNRCNVLGCNSDQVIRVMYCESGGRANAYNASSGATGLFQFMPSTFTANASRYGIAGASIWDANAQIHVATAMFANGQAGQWSCK